MSLRSRISLFFLVLAISTMAAVTPQELFTQFQQNTAQRAAFMADFVQIRHVSLFMDELKAEGTCWFEKPSKLRWEVTSPYHSVLIYSEGDMVRLEERDGEWRELDSGAKDMMSAVMEQISGWMQGEFNEASTMYEISYAEPVLKLQPRNEELRNLIQAIELTIDTAKWRITNVVIHENESDYVRINFMDQVDNPSLDPSLFDLEAHE